MTRSMVLVVVALATVTTLAAQNPVGPPADEAALNKAAAIKDPAERVDALIAVVRDYPRAVYIRNVALYLNRTIRVLPADQARPLLDQFVTGTASATAYARSEFDVAIARDLVNTNALLDRAVALAGQSVALANESDYVDNERRTHEQRETYFATKDPAYHVQPFSLAEATEKFRVFSAGTYATLGRAYLALGRLADADRTLARAYAIKPTMEAATALADVAEKRGDTAATIARLEDALLTGRMLAPGIARLHTMYAAAHGGSDDKLEAELDAKYRATFRNPVTLDRFTPPAARAADPNPRAVLAEFVTGAGCEPCVSVDLAFDAVLDRYARKDVVLLVYPMHAPTSDPMSNVSAQARHKYYAAVGAPTVYLDGRKFETGEGLGTEAVRVAKTLDDGIRSRLAEPAGAKLTLAATRAGSTIDVTATVSALSSSTSTAASSLRLHIALVEDLVSYSGENGLRFHPMIVRNLARVDGPSTDGFALDGKGTVTVTHVFDLDRITMENLRYYDDYKADLKQRTGLDATFKEQRYLINPARVSAVAFVQDDVTKAVLQSVYVKVRH